MGDLETDIERPEQRKQIIRRRPSGKFKMHEFQRNDLSFLTELKSSANFSEMGAMKTSTAEWLWSHKTRDIPNPRVLVITTKSGKGTYFESLPEVLPDWDVYNVNTTKTNLVIGGKAVPVDVELPTPLHFKPVVVVAHYNCFSNRACIPTQVVGENGLPVLDDEGKFAMKYPKCFKLLNTEWDMVIVDEAHRMKNHDTQWTRNIKKLRTQFKHVMTGTGFVNNPAELWSLLNFLYPEVYGSYWKFRETYCDEEYVSGFRKIVGINPHKEQEFRDLVKRVGVRRTMLECFPNIKEPIETVVTCELNAKQQKMYDEIVEYLQTLDAQGVPLQSPNVLSMLNRLRQITVATPKVIRDEWDFKLDRRVIQVELVDPSSKLDAAMEIIEGLEWDTERKDQVVLFSNFKDPLELMKKRLDREFRPYLHLHSGMNEKDRYEMWHDIWPQKKHQVFLCTLGVGSESINLTSAHRAIFLDQSWSPAQNKQAIGRVYRPGQTEVAQLIYIRAENTVDYRILKANEVKGSWFKSIFGTGQDED